MNIFIPAAAVCECEKMLRCMRACVCMCVCVAFSMCVCERFLFEKTYFFYRFLVFTYAYSIDNLSLTIFSFYFKIKAYFIYFLSHGWFAWTFFPLILFKCAHNLHPATKCGIVVFHSSVLISFGLDKFLEFCKAHDIYFILDTIYSEWIVFFIWFYLYW